MQDVMKTGTTTVGLLCKDGVVLAADKRATAGNLIVNKFCQKVYSIADNIAITMAGTVSDAQLLVRLIQAEINLKDVRTNRKTTVKEAANLLAGMVYGNIRRMSMIPGISHFLLGGVDHEGAKVYDIFPDGSITEVEDFISSGSGSVMAYGVLETLYKPGITMDEGVNLVLKAINAALQRDSASGGGINVIKISKDGIKEAVNERLNTQLQS